MSRNRVLGKIAATTLTFAGATHAAGMVDLKVRQFAVDNQTGLIMDKIVLKSDHGFANGAHNLSRAHWMVTIKGEKREIGASMSHGTVALVFDRSAIGAGCVFDAEFGFGSSMVTRNRVDVCKGTHLLLAQSDVKGPIPPRIASRWTQLVDSGHGIWVATTPNLRSASQDGRIRYLISSGSCPGHRSPDGCDEQKIDSEFMPIVVDCSAGTATAYLSVFGTWRKLSVDPATVIKRVCN